MPCMRERFLQKVFPTCKRSVHEGGFRLILLGIFCFGTLSSINRLNPLNLHMQREGRHFHVLSARATHVLLRKRSVAIKSPVAGVKNAGLNA